MITSGIEKDGRGVGIKDNWLAPGRLKVEIHRSRDLGKKRENGLI